MAGIDWAQLGAYAVLVSLLFIVAAAVYGQMLERRGDAAGAVLRGRAEWAAHLVLAAEERFRQLPGGEKHAWVFEQLRRYFPEIEEEEADVLIQSTVYQMRGLSQPRPASAANGAGPAAGIDDRGGALWLRDPDTN